CLFPVLHLCVCVCVCVRVSLRLRRFFIYSRTITTTKEHNSDLLTLLVGAPREKAEPGVSANQTGGVYVCPITMDQSDCSRMKLIDPDLNPSEDLYEDMWLGVSVASQGRPRGRVLACGHRFVKLFGPLKLRQMIGRCYLRGNDLQYDDSDMHWQNLNHLDDVRGEAMCNMGISASITQTEVIVGSPGSYEWQGYSVTQARRLLSKEDETIVTGAPKDNKNDSFGSVLLAVKRSKELVIQQRLRGEQTGSYFGNTVATTDINNDGWNDLLVGAPFYFHRQPEAGGAVYVYMNSGGGFDSKPSVVLRGPAGSAFGMAVSAAGDLNQDGFQDFAVGAPFHERGSVMIWTGSSKGVSTEPSQVIRGSSISPRFRTFGYSLTAGLDVDKNKYPDLVVGSLDDTVALLRTRPVIHLKKTLSVSPDVVDPNNCDFCIQVKVCLSYNFSTGEKSDRDNISSVLFVCVLQSLIEDKVEPLVFSLNVSLHEKLPKNRNVVQDLKRFPVLSQTPQPIRKQIHIQKACGSDNRCHSNLQMTAQFTDGNQKPFPIQVLHYNGSIKRLSLEINISNIPSLDRPAEDAHNAILNISIPPSLSYSAVRTKCSGDTVLLCELGNPFKSNQKVQVLIIFQPSDISLDTREILSLLQLSTISHPDPTPFSGHVIGESAMKTTEDIGSLLLFTFRVCLNGKPLGHLGNLEVEFDWPREVSNGKWLLYLTEIQVNGTSEPRCRPPNIINPLNLVVTMATSASGIPFKIKSSSIEMCVCVQDCAQGARCVTFVCPLINMNNSATLTVRARLWNSTMIEDYSDARSVLVRGRVTLKLQTNKPTINMEPQSAEIEVSIYPDLGHQVDSGAPLWIIVVSVLAGVLLLALICLVLWKCGFFRRASTRELYEAKTQKAHMKSQPSEHEGLTEEL
uniref:Uncharacterized protein n=1 Tax=Lates calcarifer TaxID=8187 RepID=A0A4W6EZP2_LATCA